MLIQAGSDPKVQQMLNNFILSSTADIETTARIFKRDSDVMLRILRDLARQFQFDAMKEILRKSRDDAR